MKMISKTNKDLSIVRQCRLLNINRASFYYEPVPDGEDTVTLMNEIQDIWERYPFYGYRRITATLRRAGYKVNPKRTQRLMSKMGLQALYPKPRLSVANAEHKKYPYLLKDLPLERPDQVWATDITYIRMNPGFISRGHYRSLQPVYCLLETLHLIGCRILYGSVRRSSFKGMPRYI